MQKILIVDDEAYSREAIADTIDWDKYEMNVICASNGKEALKILMADTIDVMLTDIRMPEMSGLELLAQVRDLGIDMEVIILSSYNEFDLVRQAMKLGTCDYLFKPTMLQQDIVESVLKAAEKQKEKRQGPDKRETEKKINDYDRSKKKEEFLYDIVSGRKMEDETLQICMENYQIPSDMEEVLVIVFKILKYAASLSEIFENDRYLMKISICNVINESLEQVQNYELICPNINEITVLTWNHNKGEEKKFLFQIDEAIRKLTEFLERHYRIDLAAGISNPGKSIYETSKLYREAVFEAEKKNLDQVKIHYASDFSGSILLKKEMEASLEYIRENLCDKNLSLQTVSDHIGVSKNYYSKEFKEATGVNFIDYITRLRVEKARNLYIYTDLKIYEIAEKVGYSDWHYLYSVYKKILGHSMSHEKRYEQMR